MASPFACGLRLEITTHVRERSSAATDRSGAPDSVDAASRVGWLQRRSVMVDHRARAFHPPEAAAATLTPSPPPPHPGFLLLPPPLPRLPSLHADSSPPLTHSLTHLTPACILRRGADADVRPLGKAGEEKREKERGKRERERKLGGKRETDRDGDRNRGNPAAIRPRRRRQGRLCCFLRVPARCGDPPAVVPFLPAAAERK